MFTLSIIDDFRVINSPEIPDSYAEIGVLAH